MRITVEAGPLEDSNDLAMSPSTRAAAEGAIPDDSESAMKAIPEMTLSAVATLTKTWTDLSPVALSETKRETALPSDPEIAITRHPTVAGTVATSIVATMATPTTGPGTAAVLRGAAVIGAAETGVALADPRP